MPEIGGRKLAGAFGDMLAGVRQAIDEVKLEVGAAITELASEVQAGREVAKAIRGEADEVRRAFGEVLGNNPPTQESAAERPTARPNGGAAA